MVLLSRIIAALAYAGAAFLFGILLGERGELGAVQYVFWVVIPVATAVLMLFSKQGGAEIILTGLMLFAGVQYGNRAFARAWDECPSRAPNVRAAIEQHHASTGDYPARLKDLGIELPCKCVLRKTILHYTASERRFSLWMTDDRTRLSF